MKTKHTITLSAFLVYALFAMTIFWGVVPVRAQQTTGDTATQSGDLVNEELTKRIQKVLVEKREQVKGAINSLIAEKRAMIGEITRITDDAITIQYQDATTIIPLSESVMLIKNNAEIKLSEIVVGNWVTLLGNKDKTTIDPEYVIISGTSLLPKEQVVLLGNVTKIDKNALTLQPRGEESTRTIQFTKTTVFQSSDGKTIKVSNLTTDLAVLITGTVVDEKTQALTIRSLAPVK